MTLPSPPLTLLRQNLKEIPTWFRATAAGQQILQDASTAAERAREDALEKIQKLRTKAGDHAVENARIEAEGAREIYKKMRELAAVRGRYAGLATQERNLAADFERAATQLERELILTADPEIDEFIFEVQELAERHRHAFSRGSASAEKRAAGLFWIESTSGAIRAAQSLKLSPKSADASAALLELREGLPDAPALLERVSAS